ncbi:hypothetical protein [Paenibacillus castaneae]|uniref:hypothetical protein n=1 Tax=Paenibacillus castaneae TaxID=474957 RepID=UPI001FBB84CF|nr:hypothetical protein [Paenibacillus castaneae]
MGPATTCLEISKAAQSGKRIFQSATSLIDNFIMIGRFSPNWLSSCRRQALAGTDYSRRYMRLLSF